MRRHEENREAAATRSKSSVSSRGVWSVQEGPGLVLVDRCGLCNRGVWCGLCNRMFRREERHKCVDEWKKPLCRPTKRSAPPTSGGSAWRISSPQMSR